MKAITVTQPFATLCAINAKRIETRGWKTDYRGPLAIHAGKGCPPEFVALAHTEPFFSILKAAGYALFGDLPRGAVIATCRLVECLQIGPRIAAFGVANEGEWRLTDQERAFGDYTPGRYAWLLADVQPLAAPIPARGALSLWAWEPGLSPTEFDRIYQGRFPSASPDRP